MVRAMYKKALRISLAIMTWLLLVNHANADVVPLELYVRCNVGKDIRTQFLSEREILSMPRHTIETSTPWSTKSQFSGVRLADVVKKTCPKGTLVTITAYDEYEINDIAMPDIIRDQPLLAYSMNGQRLLLKNFGPLFLVYDREGDNSSRIKTSQYSAKEIRQIKLISVH